MTPEDTKLTLDKFVEAMAGAIEYIKPAIAAFVESFREVYRCHGAPYGDTDEGFLQWLEELNKDEPS